MPKRLQLPKTTRDRPGVGRGRALKQRADGMGLDTGVGDAAALPSFTDFFGSAPAATEPAKSDKNKKKDKGNSDLAPAATEGQGAGKKSNTEAKQEGKKKGGIQAG